MADENLLTSPKNNISNGNAGNIVIISSNDQSKLNGHRVEDSNNVAHRTNSHKPLDTHDPPDGGTRAWFVMISAFLCNGILFGIINSCGSIYSHIQEKLKESGDDEASSKAALMSSLSIGSTFFLSLVAGILTDQIGLRKTTFLGGILATSGLFLSSIFHADIYVLYITYGIMFGAGTALAYTPTLVILGHYFKQYLGIVSGFVTAGSSVFTIILPMLIPRLINNYGLSTTLCCLSGMAMFVIVCALIYKPTQKPAEPKNRKPGQSKANALFRSLVNVNNWKKKRYVIWALSIPICLIGYFVPYVHMGKYVQISFPGQSESVPIMLIGVASGVGRILFGYIADLRGVNKIYLQQISFICIGLCTMFIPLASSYYILLLISLFIGVVDGCFISLLGPIAFDICGPRGATQAIGFLLGLCSIPLTCGPPIAGMIYDRTKSYTMSFVLAGIPPIIGAAMMCCIGCVKDDPITGTDMESVPLSIPLAKPAWIDDSLIIDSKMLNGNDFPALRQERKASTEFIAERRVNEPVKPNKLLD